MNLTKKSIDIKSWQILVLLICLLGYLYFFNVPPKNNGDDLLYWGYWHIVLHSISIMLYFRRDNQKSSYPFIALFSFFLIMAFGIPVFFINKNKFLFSQLTIESLKYSFYAYLILYIVFWFLSPLLFNRIRPFQAIKQVSIKKLHTVLLIFLLLIILNYLKLVQPLTQLVSILKNVYIGLTLLLIFRGQSRMFEKIAFAVVLSIEILTRSVSGLIAEVALLLLFILIVMYICSVRIVFVLPLLIPFMLFYTAFSKVKFSYREKVWYAKRGFTLGEKLFLIYELSQKENLKTKKLDKEGGDNFFHRYSYPSSIFSLTLRRTPLIVPYWNGTTYESIVSKFVPRILWPDKPIENLGHDFGVKYNIIRKSDKVTSINTPIFVEMYINFGLTGLYLGSALFGMLLIFVERYFNNNLVSIENQVVNSSITFSLLIIEVNFSLLFGNLFLFCIVMYFIFRFVKK